MDPEKFFTGSQNDRPWLTPLKMLMHARKKLREMTGGKEAIR
jgi:hypothetical protein